MDTIVIENLEDNRLFIKRKTIEQVEHETLLNLRIKNLNVLLERNLITQENYDNTLTKLHSWKCK